MEKGKCRNKINVKFRRYYLSYSTFASLNEVITHLNATGPDSNTAPKLGRGALAPGIDNLLGIEF
jgi:hypothetical protein